MQRRERSLRDEMEWKAASPSPSIAIRCSRAALLLSSLRRAPPVPAGGLDSQAAEEKWRRWAVAAKAALARELSKRKQLERLGELELILLAVLLACFIAALYSYYLSLF